MMAFILPYLTGAAGKYILGVAAVLTLLAGGALWLHEHDQRVLAERAAIVAAADATETLRQVRAGAAAVSADADAKVQRMAAVSRAKQEISHAVVTTSCASAPAIAAALASLRRADAASGAPGASARAAAMPGAALAAHAAP